MGEKRMAGKAEARKKIAFVCVHNSCRSQMAEALGKKYLADLCDCYSAGTEVKPSINPDAVRLMKQVHGIDMEQSQYSKLFSAIPPADIVVSMGCSVVCPRLPGRCIWTGGWKTPAEKMTRLFWL